MPWGELRIGFLGVVVFRIGVDDGVGDMPPLRGSKTYLAFTPGSRPGLLMCRPAGARFCGFASGPDGDRGKIYCIYWMGRIIRIDFGIWCGCLLWLIGCVTCRHLRGLNEVYAFTAGLCLRLVTCRLMTAALIGTGRWGLCEVRWVAIGAWLGVVWHFLGFWDGCL